MITHKLTGNAFQLAICQLEPGQVVYAEPGKFVWKTQNVGVETRLVASSSAQGGDAGQGGSGLLKKAIDIGKRAVAGEHLAFQYFSAVGGNGLLGLAGVVPGELRALELDGTRGWYTEKSTLVGAESSVNFDISFAGIRRGIRGGTGFVLEHFTGSGTLFIAAAGNFIELNPAKYGGKIQVHAGCLVAFEDTLTYGVERIGGLSAQTAMTAMFGAEGINLATLEGDGTVLLQSMSLEALANSLHPYLPSSGDESKPGLGNLF
ncbi:MAG: AIM24 family protein [Actinobacteria bacterium]|jgi:uncharacterized protein (AIM24 family)|nr:AIM24 family protein [Actinomycetota bacterium]MCL5445132.1 AIM24 family protein [Actinomycetota bacterium]